ncbi:MAG TPA: DUF459 domain-containing protein [Hyphomicrobiaceae bacterium]|nr:DUF459 domain-containing protein [Hyphomicrobiaceae bacterium]
MNLRARDLLVAVAAALSFAVAPAALAQDNPAASYITPFPEGDTYKLQVYGDAFAEGLVAGLTEAFAGDNRVQVVRKHRPIAGIARLDFDDEMKAEETSRDSVHIAVIMIGVGDRIQIRMPSRERLVLGSEGWREEYGRRVDRFLKLLKSRHIAVYWVSQPIMRRYEVNDPAQMMNDIVREKAYLNGVKYIDITANFADESGGYSAYGPDLTGKQRLLRDADGILFTMTGYRKLAHFVEQEIKRDLTQARKERAIPLAGNEAEQQRINASKVRRTDDKTSKDARRVAKTALGKPGEGNGEQKADNGRIVLKSVGPDGREEAVPIDILRPAIPAAVIALITRRESPDRPSQMGDVLAEDIGGGLVVLNSVSPTGNSPGGARRLSTSQTPYYQVLVKGERVSPKPGRADDMSWPRAEPEAPLVSLPRPRRSDAGRGRRGG